MNISISKVLLLVVGAILLIAGAWFGIEAIREKDWVAGIFALVGIAVGSVLVSGRLVTVST